MVSASEVRCRDHSCKNGRCRNNHPPARLGCAMLDEPPKPVLIRKVGSRNESRLGRRWWCKVMFQLCDRLSHKNIYASFAAVIHAAREPLLTEYVGELKGIRVINLVEVHQGDDPTKYISSRAEIRSETSGLNLRAQLLQLRGKLDVRHFVAR